MSQYAAAVPQNAVVRPEIKRYFESFYAISDTPDAHEKYSQQFTKNAKLIMASNEANGRDEILKMRQGMWEKVAKRSHFPKKIYAFDADEVMLCGSVDYTLKDGKSTSVDWAAKAHFAQEDGQLKMDCYQVYLDTAAMSRAK